MGKRETNRIDPLTMKRLIKAKVPGRHPDGWGLYLVVEPVGSARWAFMYRSRTTGKRREMGLGSTEALGLAEARLAARDARELLAEGKDPITERKTLIVVPTFGEYADTWYKIKKEPDLKSKQAKARAKYALEHHCKPIRDLPLNKVDTAAMLKVLEPIWTASPEAARKARGLIEQVLDAAKVSNYRTGENPAVWRGQLSTQLSKARPAVKHHASMSRDDLPAFMLALRAREATAARALEFQILTAARPGEAIAASWDEFDLEAKLWTVPASKMKGERVHRVPLSDRAVAIIKEMDRFREGAFVFPGAKSGKPLSGPVFERLMDRMKVTGATPHGFRSTFRDWAGEVSHYSRELAETAISHVVGDATERAYARGDALEKRRKMMADWATFCGNDDRG
jgi:integrase